MKKPIVVTMGDPAGVGPEIIVKALASGELDGVSRPLLVAGDPGVLKRAAGTCRARLEEMGETTSGTRRVGLEGRMFDLRPLSALENVRWGSPDRACGVAMADYIRWACDRCMAGEAAAMVTAPISKAAIREAGFDFPGHTEMLAERCGVEKVVMMLAGSRLRVCLVTTHLALREVPEVLSTEDILETIRITDASLRKFFLPNPKLAVLALNPHAGESGLFGDEETRIIGPAVVAARAEGIRVSGPHSADTLFHFAVRGDYDAVICMYHDQGLIPLKLLHFEDGVNVTLGLPIVRTSVDHGTAYDLAGTGKASEKSLIAAIRMAVEMAENR